MSLEIEPRQAALPGFCPVDAAVQALALAGAEERGAVFTRREVVEFILDLVGYTPEKKLYRQRLLEPSFGNGDFLLVAVERLIESWKKRTPRTAMSPLWLRDAICGVELHAETFKQTKARLLELLEASGIERKHCRTLADAWLHQRDFLLSELPPDFTHVVGNPPYVRQELIADALMAEYRRRYATIFDRADIYVPFIERSLALLKAKGKLGFICADRWMKNRYGGPLRKLVADRYRLHAYVDMVDTPAFHSDVIAYPAIVVIGNESPGPTRLAYRPKVDKAHLHLLARKLVGIDLAPGEEVKELVDVTAGSEPWLLETSGQLSIVRRLERDFPVIEDAGCKVGIGVATGADQVFIAPFEEMDVESDRKLPLVMTKDIVKGDVAWRGYGVINPFADDGKLVQLARYPKLAAFLNRRGDEIRLRHVSKKNPTGWYRTIDRIYPSLTYKPKLLIPDIKGSAHIVFEDGRLYPHHNLYFITSEEWDLRALQAVLMSGIARLFVSTYSTKMRGGYLRFQAQYLRRIRVPLWKDVPEGIKQELCAAAIRGDMTACNDAAFRLYGLTASERASIVGQPG